LDINDDLLDFDYSRHYFTDWKINETQAILTSRAGDSLQLKQISVDDEFVIFTMNDKKFKIETGGLVLISVFSELREIAAYIWAPHSNQFINQSIFNDQYGEIEAIVPLAIMLAYKAGTVDYSPPPFYQEKDWCIKEIQSQVGLINDVIELNPHFKDDPDFGGLFDEWNEMINSHRHDCYQLIFPNQEAYSWGRDDAGYIHCPMIQSIE